jgi:tetratricopeptide (TPR) repeat protein
MAQTTLREYLQMTEDAINSDRVNEAFANCQYILTHFPELLEGRRLLGEIYLKQGHLEEAQQTFDWVLTNDPENVVSYCSRALISERLKDYDTALDCYQQAYELSRGISHIRQEFNQLSEKVGQHGFIFSRAGLARLYMRGDLLPQAIQEWESVLAATPDRLDARTGLLETFWREGLYDRVEQLAKQILNEVPHCLKALVLLAHVTFAQNALQSREFIQQAKELDPDLVIAQELFSDFMVSHPKDPFLTLLKQSSTVLSEEKQAEEPTPVKTVQSVPVAANGTAATSTFSDPLVRWSSLDNIIEPQQEYQTMQEASSFGSWTSNSSSELDSWSLYGQSSEALGQRNVQEETAPESQPQQINNEISVIPEQPGTEQERPWYHMDIFEEHSAESWNSALPSMETTTGTPWEEKKEKQDTDIPAPPAWLDMLTKGEHREASGKPSARTAPTPPTEAEEPPKPKAVEPPSTKSEIVGQTPLGEARDSMQAAESQSTQDDDEGFFFGPEWLKSLGATTFDSPDSTTTTKETLAPAPFLSNEPQPTRSNMPTEPVAQAALVIPEQPAESTSSSQAETSAQNWLDQAAQKLSTSEQDVLSTLKDL